jgi:CubicO group peptidase (beta-lactamase class C family)
MKGTLEFDGRSYLDGEASDPKLLGLMRGTPPASAQRIRFEDDEFYKFPQIRWSLSHMRELVPTTNIWRGSVPPSSLASAPSDRSVDLDALKFETLDGQRMSWQKSLLDTYTDGILVMHRGRCVYERYFGELQPHRPHACFSITKSYAATLASTLLHEGVLDECKPIPFYLPEMRGTAYGDATLREVLDMQVGVQYAETYADPNADIWKYGRAGGMRPLPHGYTGPTNFYDYLVTLQKEGGHGEAFAYKTINTEVLCWVMTRVTGLAWSQLLSDRLWSQLGCEQDGYVSVDSTGVAMGGGGLNATLRDMARFGELMRCDGSAGGRQIIPSAVIADIRRGADLEKFEKAGYTLLPGYSYRNMWWVASQAAGVIEGRGIYGQRLYIAPKEHLVVARFASHPIATSAANDPITLPAFAAISRALN